MESGQLQCLRHVADSAVHGVNPVPCLPFAETEGFLQTAGSRDDLHSDRWDIHTDSARGDARWVGVESVWRDLGIGDCWSGVQSAIHRTVQDPLDPGLPRDGMDDRDRMETDCRFDAGRTAHMGSYRRRMLHTGRDLLRVADLPVSSHGLAPFRTRRIGCPLVRNADAGLISRGELGAVSGEQKHKTKYKGHFVLKVFLNDWKSS